MAVAARFGMDEQKKNVGKVERIASVVLGGGMMIAALFARGIVRTVAGMVGSGLVARGTSGHCPLYGALGIDRSNAAGIAGIPAPVTSGPGSSVVDEASQESFPASDPPSFSPITGTAR